MTGAGSFTITRNAQNGLPESINDGILNTTRTFSGYGELDALSYAIAGNILYGYTLTRDLGGRITQKVETLGGATDTHDYTYDANGRLTEVKRNGLAVEAYSYDANGNRIQETNAFKGFTDRPYTFSTEDHLITAGPDTYQFDPDGFLIQKTTPSGTMTTSYSSRGELLSATLPGGTTATYDHDPMGRRIAKRVNGMITEKYLWANIITLLAVYDGNDNLLMRFNYADSRMPVSMTYNGSTYYFFYDQVGSLKAVSDSAGNILKRIDYDSFGSIINDNNPSLRIPFGFAGGLHDRDTGLVRFGARDYDPAIGRWTAKDPIDFAGGDTNLFMYIAGDPVNGIDPMGLFGAGLNAGEKFLGHSDFVGNDRFDWNKEDYDWMTSPFNPFSTWRHFRDLYHVLPEIESAVISCDKNKFERLMHQAQDYYSHFRAGYRAHGTKNHPLVGHILDGTRPDKNAIAWEDANNFTINMIKKWDNNCKCKRK
ncbi:MAG: hypothetical protein HY879_14380 [Deltaproteobacteria bacterium]|nr:hypothetical protein [Deltaproteobacteria bacterium]